MLTIRGKNSRALCNGVSRRRFIEVGGLSLFGLTLADLLRQEAVAGPTEQQRRKKSVILVWQHGGPSQLDTFDMKPSACLLYTSDAADE